MSRLSTGFGRRRNGAISLHYRANFTTTRDPAATCDPATGSCSRAKPLPTTSRSSPLPAATSTADRTLLLANTGGFGLLARAGDLVSRQRGGKSFLTLEADDKPLPPSLCDESTKVACLTLQGRMLVFGLDELKLQPNGGRGLTLIDLEPKDALVSVAAFTDVLQVLGTGRGGTKDKDETLRGAALAAYEGKRARKGKKQDVMVKAMRVLAAPKR